MIEGILLEKLFDGLLEHVLTLSTDHLVDDLSPLDEEDGGDVAYAEATWQIIVLVDVALADDYLAFVFLGELFDEWTYHLAGTAPSGPKVYDYGFVASGERVKVLAVDF